MPQTITLGRLFDIRVGVHISWLGAYAFLVLALMQTFAGFGRQATIALAAGCGLLLFASIVAHEFAHALVARRFGVRTRGITLFLFGGVALLESEPPSPRADALIAIAGPALSALLAVAGFGVLAVCERSVSGAFGGALELIVSYVTLANGALAVFNLIPAFPMDGGRVLRAVLWHARKSRAAATGAASIVGLLLAAGLAIAGVVATVTTHAWRDTWYVLIGGFLLQQGYAQLRDSRQLERLERVRVGDVMDAPGDDALPLDGFSLAPSASALDAVSAFRSSTRTQIAVVDAGHLAGWLRRERTLGMLDHAA